jgi:hypothetical protein
MEVWQWCSFTWNLSNHVVGRIICSHTSILVLRTIGCRLGNLFWRGNTTVTSNIVNTVSWDIVWCSRVISVNVCRLPVISWLWMEVGKRSSLMFVMVFMVVAKPSSLSTSHKESNYLCIFH